MTMNVHMLQHIPGFVEKYGPLWAYSCFPFEAMNAHLKNMIHGNKGISTQVSTLCDTTAINQRGMYSLSNVTAFSCSWLQVF